MATEETEHIKLSSCDENEILNAFEEVGLQLSKNDSQKNEKVQADDELMNCKLQIYINISIILTR